MLRHRKQSDHQKIAPTGINKNFIVIRKPEDLLDCKKHRRYSTNHLKPVIDLTGNYKDFADLYITSDPSTNSDVKNQIQEIVLSFNTRKDDIPYAVQKHKGDCYRLLSWMYVSNQDLNLIYDPMSKMAVSHSPFAPIDNASEIAVKLYKQGYLSRKFFDCLHQCNSCGSSRLNVREECMTCRSADIKELQIIHHFTCGWQGPESDYTQDRDLVCPKCQQHLLHYGSDYEKSGIVMHCHDCDDSHSTASVGFLCLDCQAHQDSETMETIRHYDYFLNDKGIEYLLHSFDAMQEQPLLQSDNLLKVSQLPLKVQQEIIGLRLGIAPSRNEGIHPFVLIEISYTKTLELTEKLGKDGFDKLRDRLKDNLRATIREHDLFVKGVLHDYLLLKETKKDTILDEKSNFLERCQHEISHDLGIVIRFFDNSELSYE